MEERILPLGEAHGRRALALQPPVDAVEFPRAEAHAPVSAPALGIRRHGAASQNAAHARQEFAQAEGLGQVIVGAELQAKDAVDLLPPMSRDDDDRDVRGLADDAEQVEAVLMAELQVEDEQAGLGLELFFEFMAVRRKGHAHAAAAEVFREHALHGRIVVGDEDPGHQVKRGLGG